MNPLNLFQEQILFGLLLGNGNLQTLNKGETYRFRFIQSEVQQDYFHHIFRHFREYTQSPPWLALEKRPNGKVYGKWCFNTRTFPWLKSYAELFFRNGKKVVPMDLKSLLTARTLAYWFMDNGCRKGRKYKGFRFCTDNLDEEDVRRLQQILETKFDLRTSIVKNRHSFRLVIRAKSHQAFVSLVDPYIIRSMKHKLY